ncbi:tetraacyldisaccharide 4'-kinase [Kangiella sp. TOML190]|uniref:tetraacyldisaccharide 4'-kinase n=1 Tax=Kangiella sp. TOML190 TaxID=2931351 RepID=UPI00203ECFCE|nr:tetraacyldisaccharide 4'-kinase [Kangiella sp. TOML190]
MAVSKTQQFFESIWYVKKSWWLYLFYPLHWLLALLVILRRACYKLGIFNSAKPNVPVIVIGNINVGGTGKTPLAIHLLKFLKAEGFKPGLVTRGYGGQSEQYPIVVEQTSKPCQVGDEPKLIFNNTQSPVVVDRQRARGAQKLVDEFSCDLILCDDGLQHYALQRDIEILVVDAERQFGNGLLMPLGPLREPVSRASQTDLTVVNGDTMQLNPAKLRSVKDRSEIELKLQGSITAIAAIGNPQRFYNTLTQLGYEFSSQSFADHHHFSPEDFENIEGSIIMTEKDAVKCQEFANDNCYYLPVTAQLAPELSTNLLNLIRQKAV